MIIATHSEVVINAVDPKELCALLDVPRRLANDSERAALVRSLSALTNLDIMLAREKRNVLYVEGHTDLDLLREWARVLEHRAVSFLEQPFWKPVVFETRQKAGGIKADEHFKSLLLVQEAIRGVQVGRSRWK